MTAPAQFNLAAHVLAAGSAAPDRIALAVLSPARTERWSHGRLAAAVRGTATGLRARGLAPGDRILLRIGNTPDFPVAFLAAIAAGLVPVPTSVQLTGPEITRMAGIVDPALVIAAPGVPLPDHPAPVLPLADLRAMAALPPAPFALGDPERPAYIIFTSGTSGQPRAVVHAHRAILARALMSPGWTGIGPGDRVFHAGALNWTYTLGTGLLDPWTAGATALIPAEGTDPAALPLLLARHEATIFAGVPGLYRRILRAPLPRLPALRHGLSAGEKLSDALRARWEEATGTTIHEAYGQSECSTFISGSPARPAPPGTIGFAQPGRRIAILDGSVEAPDGTPGAIAVHRSDPGLMLGYLGAPDATAARMRGEWFLTGDLGCRSAEGAVIYLGRADDMITAGGHRISPVEVEEALAACPGLTEVAAVELRLRADTTVVAAFWSGPEVIAEADLAAFAGARLARYKCPRLWIRVPRLPRGANGKVLRRQLKSEWEAAHGPT
jgi:acyl-coenzyme A synthetase/AMP-(fatty) acid ligase